MADKLYYPNNNNIQLKNCKSEKYKIDNHLRILYKVSTIYNDVESKIFKTLPLEKLDSADTDFFFMLMKNHQCDDFTMYYEDDYDIKKVINSFTNQELVFTSQQLVLFKQFFVRIKNVIITLFDKNIKPIINNTVDSNSSNNSISNSFQTKPRILN